MQTPFALRSRFRLSLALAGLIFAGCSPDELLDPSPERATPTPVPPSATAVALPPIPTATPTPVPTPTPPYRDTHYEKFRRDLQEKTLAGVKRIEAEVEELYPRVNIGDTALIRTRGGVQVEGRLQFIVDGDVMIATPSGSRTFNADDLDAYTRLRIDGGFRTNIIGVEAAYEAFYALSEEYDLEQFDLEGTLSERERAEMGQPEPLLALAAKASAEGKRPEAFHLNRILAAYGHAAAKRDLALLFFQGEVVERDTRQGEALLMDAADQGDEKAIELLAELRRRMETAQSHAQDARDSTPKYKTVYVSDTCPHCDGKGYRTPGFSKTAGSKKLPCKCGGTGKIRVPKTMKVQ